MTQTWIEVRLELPQDLLEPVANFLLENGAPGLEVDDRAETITLTAHFPDHAPVAALERYCRDLQDDGTRAACRIHVRAVADENWAENWKLHFQPQRIGTHLYVCPPWDRAAPAGSLSIVIDPGMAFGTGHHATTRACLQLLEAACAAQMIARALDVGTGSGILAIALATLGVTEVEAVDIDPTACAAAAVNAAANHVASRVHVSSTLETVTGTFDLIVANLFTNLLQTLAAELPDRLRANGTLILSGFLTADECQISAAYETAGLTRVARVVDGEWVALQFARTDA